MGYRRSPPPWFGIAIILAAVVIFAVVIPRTAPIKFDDKTTEEFRRQGDSYRGAYASAIQAINNGKIPLPISPEEVARIISETLARMSAQGTPPVADAPTAAPGEAPPAEPPAVGPKTEFSDPRSQTILAPYIKAFYENAPKDPYWSEPNMGGAVECVGLIKRYQHEVLGLDYSYLRDDGYKFMTWPTNYGNGWPNNAVVELINGNISIFDPNMHDNGHDVITFPDGAKYKFHYVVIPPSMHNQLEFGDIIIWGSYQQAKNGTPGHVGMFAGYPDGPDGQKIMQLDENGGAGSETAIPADAIQFHTFSKDWLNDHGIAVRVILDEKVN